MTRALAALRLRSQFGFTLVELLIVMLITAILLSVASDFMLSQLRMGTRVSLAAAQTNNSQFLTSYLQQNLASAPRPVGLSNSPDATWRELKRRGIDLRDRQFP